jgi:ribonuclease III
MINEILGYRFNNISLLKEALTHPSLCSHSKNNLNNESYERLEFLGDSVLNFIISELLMNKFPNEDEGKLAKRKANLVSGEVLARIAIAVNLGDKIDMTESEARSGGRENANNLENALEAIIGAIYLDAGFDVLKPIIYNLWQVFLDEMPEVPIDPKSKLQEILQARGKGLPIYELIESFGPKHKLTFKVRLQIPDFKEVVAQGKSKQQAEKEAAKLLLDQIYE